MLLKLKKYIVTCEAGPTKEQEVLNMKLTVTSMPGAPFYANVVFSLLTGCLLLFGASWAASFLGINTAVIPGVIGGSLIFFAGHILMAVNRSAPNFMELAYITALDFLWVAGSVVLLVAFPEVLSREGRMAVLAVGLIVEGFGSLQAWGLWRMSRKKTA